MRTDNKLLDMLTGYAAAHQHPFNVAVHMVGIPTIMLGVLIPLSWVQLGTVAGVPVTLAHLLVVAFTAFYATLDRLFAAVFLGLAVPLASLAAAIAGTPSATNAALAALLFTGGYVAQFVGHAVERSMPVIVNRPLQANLAAPFFTVVELFKLLGLRDSLFNEVQQEIARRRGLTSPSPGRTA